MRPSSSPRRSPRNHQTTFPSRAHQAFTLIELLVVIGIIAVLISILLPTLKRARETANDTRCRSNLSQMGLALKMYAHDNKDHFPSPNALGEGTAGTAPSFRRGINEPDPVDPTKVET